MRLLGDNAALDAFRRANQRRREWPRWAKISLNSISARKMKQAEKDTVSESASSNENLSTSSAASDASSHLFIKECVRIFCLISA